jgi:hypothetical protein
MLTDVNGAPTYAAMSYPSIEVDPSNANRIGIVYAADPDAGIASEQRLDVGDQPPGNADAWLNNWQSGAAASPGWAFAAWTDFRNSPLSDIYFRRSITAAGTWGGEVNLTANHPNTHNISYSPPAVVTSGNGVFLTWGVLGPDISPTFPPFVHYTGSLDNGMTWQPVVHLDVLGTANMSHPPVIAASGLNICVAWANFQPPSTFTIYANYSTNGGATWQNPEIVVATRTAIEGGQLSIAGTGNNFYIVWDERFNISQDRDIYVSVSNNAGMSWSSPTKLDTHDTLSINWSQNAKICCTSGGNVYVLWYDEWPTAGSLTDFDPTFARSTNFGVSWSADVRLNDGLSNLAWPPPAPEISCNGNNVHVIYQSDRLNLAGVNDIYFIASTDGGATWPGTDIRLDTGDAQEANLSDQPKITTNGTAVYAVYRDYRNGQSDVYANWSANNGVTWQPADMRLDIGNPPGASPVRAPCVAADAVGPCYIWEDGRNSLFFADIYAYQPTGNGPDEGDILYVESLNGGATWSAPLRVNDDATTNDQSHPWLDIKPNGTVDVVWYDRRNDAMDQNPETYFAALLPGAAAFTPNVPVSTQPIIPPPVPGNWLGDYIWIDVDQTHAHIVWEDTRTDPAMGDIFYHNIPNPTTVLGWANHNVGNCTLTMTCQGILGFMDGTQSEGSGFIYPAEGENQLYIGGLWLGVDETYVANRDYDADPATEWFVSADPSGYPEIETGGEVDQRIQTRYTDDGAGMPRGLFVRQESWAFESAPYDDFVIIRYHIHNQGPAPLLDLYAGVFLDLDLGSNPWDDQGYVEPGHQAVYMTDGGGRYVGLAYLNGPAPIGLSNLTTVHNPTYVHPQDFVLDGEKMAFLQATDPVHTMVNGLVPDEYSILASAGPFTLGPGDSTEVVFAVLGGDDEGDLLINVEAAQSILDQIITGVPGFEMSPPMATRLLANSPNPFNPSTTIRFQLAQPAHVELAIYDVSGRLVRTLTNEQFGSGVHSLEWNGRDEKGRCAASGVYLCRLVTGSSVYSRRVLMLK